MSGINSPKDPEEELIEYEAKSLEQHVESYKQFLQRARAAGNASQVDFLEKTIAELETIIRDTPRLEQVRARYAVQHEAIKAYNLGMNLMANARQTEARAHLLRFLELLKDEACYLYVPLKAKVHHNLALTFGFNMTDLANHSVQDLERALNEISLASESCEGYAQEESLALAGLKKDLSAFLKTTRRDELRESIFGKELSPEALEAYKQGKDFLRKGKEKEGRERLKFFLQQKMPYDEKWREASVRFELALSYWATREYDTALSEIRLAKEYYETTTGYGGKKLTDDFMYRTLCTFEERIAQERKKDL